MIPTHDRVAPITVFKCVAVRTIRLHQTLYVPQSCLECTNAFHTTPGDIGYLVNENEFSSSGSKGHSPLPQQSSSTRTPTMCTAHFGQFPERLI